jgi:hypothetical protein
MTVKTYLPPAIPVGVQQISVLPSTTSIDRPGCQP